MSLRAASPALVAALLFGASTPLAKLLLGAVAPAMLAGLLYLGSGLGLGVWLLLRRSAPPRRAQRQISGRRMPRNELISLWGAIVIGGMAGPWLLMLGLARTSAASASLLLNLEAVFTAAMAWWVFKENADRRVMLGMAAIVAGGVVLSWDPAGTAVSDGALFVIAACLCWAIDNNLTRGVSSVDASEIACLKGLVAGSVNTMIGLMSGAALPPWPALAASLLVGLVGYGLSLTLFVTALRRLGTARTGAYFSVAPLFGVIVSWVLWPAMPGALFWVAAALMGIGVWCHVRERHEHEHAHEELEHSHRHRHDDHHRHAHAFDWDGTEPHVHPHRHEALTHRHHHYPDDHHRHVHR